MYTGGLLLTRIVMLLPLKLLLYAVLGSLLLLPGLAVDREGRTGARQAERALMQWLGGAVALCLPGNADLPGGNGDNPCHPCCLPMAARSPAILPETSKIRPPGDRLARPAARSFGTAVTVSLPRLPQQPRAPPGLT